MAIAFVQQATGGTRSMTSSVAVSISTTTGNCLVALIGSSASGTGNQVSSVTDSAGNTWTAAPTPVGVGPSEAEATWTAVGPTGWVVAARDLEALR